MRLINTRLLPRRMPYDWQLIDTDDSYHVTDLLWLVPCVCDWQLIDTDDSYHVTDLL